MNNNPLLPRCAPPALEDECKEIKAAWAITPTLHVEATLAEARGNGWWCSLEVQGMSQFGSLLFEDKSDAVIAALGMVNTKLTEIKKEQTRLFRLRDEFEA